VISSLSRRAVELGCWLAIYYVTARVGWRPVAEVEGNGETLLGVCVGSHHSDAPESRFPSFFAFVSPCSPAPTASCPLSLSLYLSLSLSLSLSLFLRVALSVSVRLVSSLRDRVVWTTTRPNRLPNRLPRCRCNLRISHERKGERKRERGRKGGRATCRSDALECALILFVNGRDLGETLLAGWSALSNAYFQALEREFTFADDVKVAGLRIRIGWLNGDDLIADLIARRYRREERR